jgi:hypothetical protein
MGNVEKLIERIFLDGADANINFVELYDMFKSLYFFGTATL